MPKDSDTSLTNVLEVDFKTRSSRTEKNDVRNNSHDLEKRDLFARWLSFGTVCVLVDARHARVKVPPEFKHQGDLRLNFSYDFHIADFNFNADITWATLAFENGEYFCSVPFSAIYGIQSAEQKQGAIWFEDFPSDHDQYEVLGFTEDMCLNELAVSEKHEPRSSSLENVVEIDFSKRS